MRLNLRKPTQALNKAYAKQSIALDRMENFRRALARLFSRLDETESEEHQKNIVAGFLNDAFYAGTYEINTRERIDLVVHRGPSSADPAGVIIEAKRVHAGEMMTTIKNNVRALHELILYYFEERERHQNVAISQLIITDVHNWFIFDENDFRHHFYDNPKLSKLYQIKQQQRKDNPFFYAETARILRELDDEVPVTYLNLRELDDVLALDPAEGNRLLIPAYKLFSPEHLLKLPFANDANTLNRQFYNELLHILGLHETTEAGRKLIQRLPANERLDGSLLENTINQLRVDNVLTDLDQPEQYGTDEAGQLFTVALTLCITWLNRILFLKLLEGQLVRYHAGDRSVQFLTPRHIREYDDLNELFFEVLAVPEDARPAGIVARYDTARPGPVPYLNSSLFELTDLERHALKIKGLKDRLELPLFGQTALKDAHGRRQTGQLPTLTYLLAFLDAYDFSSDGPAEIQTDNKPLINAAVLGLIFEKLNGYRDGSFFTPGFVTMYMVGDVIRRAVLNRFNEALAPTGPPVESIEELANYLGRFNKPDELLRFNAIVNSLRIVDPAVGSGHFLVSALNELIALKAELGILCDAGGRRLRYYDVGIVNDELVISDETGEPYQYLVGGKGRTGGGQGGTAGGTSSFPASPSEQELIFHEKQTLIETCLFGVDINPNSVNICRLRLWIELLKSAYYVRPANVETAPRLQTLPNLDINLRVGNSLVSRAEVGSRLPYDTEGLQNRLTTYRTLVQQYFREADKGVKRQISQAMRDVQNYFAKQFSGGDKTLTDRLTRLTAEFVQKYDTGQLFSNALTPKQIKDRDKLQADIARLQADLETVRNNPIFRNAFEWRYAFPEVLDEGGNFVGFDVVVGNPPYGVKFTANERKKLGGDYVADTDIYTMFIERGLQLLRENGQLGFIIPTSWQTGDNFLATRKLITKQSILEIGITLPYNVFEEAYVDTGIYIFRKGFATEYSSAVFEFNPRTKIEAKLSTYLNFDELPASSWVNTPDLKLTFSVKAGTIRSKLAIHSKKVSDITDSVRGILANKEDVANGPLDDTFKPFFTGKLNRYTIEPITTYVRYGENLREKPKSYKFFVGERILVRRIVSRQFRVMATLVEDEFVSKKDLYTFVITDTSFSAKYILAIINSALISYLKTSGSTAAKKDDFTQLTLSDIREIPIPDVAPDAQAPIIEAVDAILTAKRHDPNADTQALETRIDELVFALYHLTDERALVLGT